jgi:glutamate N-acetyltransferase / amino-acid N-acetyltransferase
MERVKPTYPQRWRIRYKNPVCLSISFSDSHGMTGIRFQESVKSFCQIFLDCGTNRDAMEKNSLRREWEKPMETFSCLGFKISGVAAGIKKNKALDLGLIFSETPAAVAGVFTRNRVKAAPVQLNQQRIGSGQCRAVIVNSGNANCCNGEEGLVRARQMAKCAAERLFIPEESVLVASTGVIGAPLPIEKIIEAAPQLVSALKPDGWMDFAQAIMTTDTFPKLISRKGMIDGKTFTLAASAKGAGMIHPDMATMLAFICTDAGIDSKNLQEILGSAVDASFNRITIDGDTSTNDTVLLLANGSSGVVIQKQEHLEYFQDLLDGLCLEMARLLVKDGEGATKLVDIAVRGAETDADAAVVARTIAGSMLVKTALFGEDANWGRIIGAVGRAGVAMDPDKIDIFFNDVMMVKNGKGCGKQIEALATEVLKKPEFTIVVDLHLGLGEHTVMTCDFSMDYVKINANYRS